jgi:hypothetical protein
MLAVGGASGFCLWLGHLVLRDLYALMATVIVGILVYLYMIMTVFKYELEGPLGGILQALTFRKGISHGR